MTEVVWLVETPVREHNGRPFAVLASARYRAFAPAEYLRECGYDARIVNLCEFDSPQTLQAARKTWNADVVIGSKILTAWRLEAAAMAREDGARLVMDVCDDHFDRANYGESFTSICQRADGLVSCSAILAERMERRFGRSVEVIAEAYEAPAGTPRFAPDQRRIELLWFGSRPNVATLGEMIPGLGELGRRVPLRLHLISTADAIANREELFARVRAQYGQGLEMRFSPWSPETVWRAMEETDLVLLPSRDDAWWQGKSPNRMVETLRRGRYAIAYPLDAYRQFASYAMLTDNIAEGVARAITSPESVVEQIGRGQAYVERTFSPEAIGTQWTNIVNRVARPSSSWIRAPYLLRGNANTTAPGDGGGKAMT